MEFLLNRFRNLTVLLVVVMAQLLLLAYQVKGNQEVRLIRMWSVTAVTPLAKVLEVVRRNTIGVVEDYFVLINVREENRRLADELGKMKMENHFLKSELQTADRAQALRAFQTRTPSRTIPARIIGTGTGANSRVVYVDRGSGAGILRGMAVVTPEGIVGKVLDSYPTASQVLLITDPSFAAGVISQKNRVHGTIKGLGQSKCLVDYVQNEEKVEPGEMFYTSGDDRIFPKGMPVGRVTVARQGKTFKEIFVVPNGFQNGLEEVLIVVQGEHQPIPDQIETSSAPGMYLMEPPKEPSAPAPAPSVLTTEADRMREQYKEVGEAQGHSFGEGGPGARPPNFNLRVEQPKPAAAPPAVVPGAASVGAAATGQPGTVAQPSPSASGTGQTSAPVAPRPAPAVATGSTAQTTQPGAPATQRVGPDGLPIVSRPKPTTPPVTGQATQTGAPAIQRVGPDGLPIVSRPKPTAPPTTGQATQTGAPATQRVGPDGLPIVSRPKPTTPPVTGQATQTGAPATQRVGPDGLPIVSRPKPTAPPVTGQATQTGAPATQRVGPDGLPIVSRPKPTAPPTTGQPAPSSAPGSQRVGPDGQPPVSRPQSAAPPKQQAPTEGQPPIVSPKKPPITVEDPPAAPPADGQRRVVTNDTTINIITPAPKQQSNGSQATPRTTEPAPRPAAPPRTTAPAAAKPKPDRSETPANP